MKNILCITALLALVDVPALLAQTKTKKEKRDGDQVFILENKIAKVVVFPEAGGAIIEFIDKRTGTNFVTGPVKRGAASYGWKDVTRLHPQDPASEWMGARPYKAYFTQGEQFRGIAVICEAGHLRVEREIRLMHTSTELSVVVRHTNISSEPKTIWLRWHPYMVLDDVYARTSAILIPGPGLGTMRRIPVGAGWEAHFMDVPGYWMASNYKSGAGMWMTFEKKDVAVCSTWTDYKFHKHPRRGWFTAELFPKAELVPPGKSLELHCSYQPFTASDELKQLSMRFIAGEDREAAKRFLGLVRPNLDVVSTHTMVTQPNNWLTAVQQNRFHFNHRRRDRFALQEWGIVDAMMSVPGDQSHTIRTRLFAHIFDSWDERVSLRYGLNVTDGRGKEIKSRYWNYNINPAEHRNLDLREDLAIDDLPDGRYTFTLSVYAGREKSPVHVYTEKRKLHGRWKPQMAEARRKKDAKPLIERERPFVTALRTIEVPNAEPGALMVPIGVEEASGIERKQWPVRVGVPFAKGILKKGQAIDLRDAGGVTTIIQTHVMGTWRDGSVKWLLVDFQADVPANGFAFYSLHTGGKLEEPVTPLIREQDELIVIVSGEGGIRWEMSRNPPDKVMNPFRPGDLWWTTAGGKRYTFRLEGEGAGISIVENGPLRAVVRAVGWYFAEDVKSPIAMGDLRFEFYRGKGYCRLYHTFTYSGDPWQDKIGSTGIRFSYPQKKTTKLSIELDGKPVEHSQTLQLWQGDEESASATSGNRTIAQGRRSTGAAALHFGDSKTIIYHRNLWQMFPKQIDAEANRSSVTFRYWPERAGPLDWRPREDGWIPSSSSPEALAVGVSRTHEFILDFAGQYKLAEYDAAFNEPVLAVVPPRYLCYTGALLHLQPYDPEKVPELENLISDAFDSYIQNGELHGWYGEWRYGTIPNIYRNDEHRWADYGRYGNLLNEQDVCHVPWLAYLRSGDRKYLKFAEANTRHLMEVGTIRLHPVWPEGVGMSRRHHECIWLGTADYGHSMLDPFLELYHATGYRPAWEAAERMAKAMAEQRTGSWRYISNPVAGLARMYLETQDVFYKKHADRIWKDICAPDRNRWYAGDHGSRMALYYSQFNDDCKKFWKDISEKEEKQKSFQSLDSLAALYGETGNIRYAKEAAKNFSVLAANCQRYDPKREDPFWWGIAYPSQHVLSALRQMVYASEAIEAGRRTEAKENQ